MRFYLIISLTIFLQTAQAQKKENSIWYFGNMAGLSFLNTPPTPLTNGAMNTDEGCASVADSNGVLLFYTNGFFVWNKNHVIMTNGSGLEGTTSGTQSSLILKKPGADSLYYIFTLGSSLEYSIVDMGLAAGLGSVTVKNYTILNMQALYTSEKVHGVRHCNGVDYWVVTHPMYGGTFYSFLLSATGVNTVAVTSTVGEDTLDLRGALKISPGGKKIAIVDRVHMSVNLHDFNIGTGTVSSSSIVLGGLPDVYYVEFSPDGSKLYTSDGLTGTNSTSMYQYDLCAGSDAAIKASKTLLHSENTISGGALQLAPDGKIYRCRFGKDTLGVINNPNAAGLACNYTNSGPWLGGKVCYWGLPNIVPEPQKVAPTISQSANCQKVSFNVQVSGGSCTAFTPSVLSTTWNFGDPVTLAQNTSSLSNPQHFYSVTGTFTAQLIVNYTCGTDTVLIPVVITSLSPTLNISGDSTICAGEKTILTATATSGALYKWSSGQTTSSISAGSNTSSTIQLTVTGSNGCSNSKQFHLVVDKCVGVNSIESARSMQLYPNPAQENIKVIFDESDYSVRIADCFGALRKTFENNGQATDISLKDLVPGLYFLIVEHKGVLYTKKFVKE